MRIAVASRTAAGIERGQWDSLGRWSPFLLPGTVVILAAFLVPLIQLLRYSLYRQVTAGVVEPAWTLHHYWRFFTTPNFWAVLWNTVLMGVSVTAFCLVLGYPLALAIVRSTGRWTSVLLFLTISPLLASPLVRGLGWTMALSRSGWVNEVILWLGVVAEPVRFLGTLGAIILGLTHGLLPFMVLSLASSLSGLDPQIERAAVSLGAARRQVFWRILLPLSLPGIVSGSLLVFCIAVGTYGTPYLLGGPGFKILALTVYDYFTTLLNWPFGAALAVILMATVMALIALYLRLLRRPWQA